MNTCNLSLLPQTPQTYVKVEREKQVKHPLTSTQHTCQSMCAQVCTHTHTYTDTRDTYTHMHNTIILKGYFYRAYGDGSVRILAWQTKGPELKIPAPT